MVQVQYDAGGGPTTCGGALLSATHVLTNAHCAVGDVTSLKVYTGTASLWSSGTAGAVHGVRAARQHPKYRIAHGADVQFVFDVAVLRLQDSVVLDAQASTIRVTGSRRRLADGAAVSLAGWGLTYWGEDDSKKLRLLSVTVLNRRQCRARTLTAVTPQQFCITSAPDMGNSGSAAYVGGLLYGLMSWGGLVFTDLAEPSINSFVATALRTL